MDVKRKKSPEEDKKKERERALVARLHLEAKVKVTSSTDYLQRANSLNAGLDGPEFHFCDLIKMIREMCT